MFGVEETKAAIDRRVGVGDDEVTSRRIRRNHGVLIDEDLAVIAASRNGNRLPLQLNVNLRNADDDDTAAARALPSAESRPLNTEKGRFAASLFLKGISLFYFKVQKRLCCFDYAAKV